MNTEASHKNRAAATLGRMGGKSRSKAKLDAVKANLEKARQSLRKLTDADIAVIRQSTEAPAVLAARFGVHVNTIKGYLK